MNWIDELEEMESVSFLAMVGYTIKRTDWLHSYDTVRLHMTDGTVFVVRSALGEVNCYKSR